jgi:hypothetical protein
MPFHQVVIVLGQAHGDQILAAHDVGRIGRGQVGGIYRGGGKSLAFNDRGLLTRKLEGIRSEYPTLAQVSSRRVEDIGKAEIDVAFTGPDPEQMPVIGICPGRDRKILGDLGACMRAGELPGDGGRTGDQIAPEQGKRSDGSGNSASYPTSSPTRPMERSRTFQSFPGAAQDLSAVFK